LTPALDLELDRIEPLILDDTDAWRTNAIDLWRLTDPQHDWVSLTHRRAIWRAGNSIGKSHAQAWDIIQTARGTHPFRPVKRPPVLLLVVGYSWAQMDPLCKKLWELLPKDEIDPKVRYEPANGFRGFKEPVIPFVSGPGAGSVIVFATYEQGPGRIMGIQVDGAYMDEPPPADVYGEIVPRLNAKKGFLRVTFTPTPESPDLEYLRKEVDAWNESGGKRGVFEHQTSLTPDAVTPRHAERAIMETLAKSIPPTPWMSQTDITEALDSYLEEEREMREHGAWYPLQKGRWVSTYTDENYVDFDLAECRGAFLVVSLDHGAQAGKQAAMLSAYRNRDSLDPLCWWIDECLSDGASGVREDAAAILAMLARHRINGRPLTYDDVDLWVGDRAVGDNKFLTGKDNQKLIREMARQLGRRVDTMAHVIVPHKYHGSVRHGAQLLKNIFKKRDQNGVPLGKVHRRCLNFHDSLLKFKGDPRDPCKDSFDAGRYGAEAALRQRAPVGFLARQ
jgi:phage terminase large subunit-like protein